MLNQLLEKLFPKKLLYVTLAPNHVKIKEMETGKSISRQASVPFSNDRLLVADFLIAEKFIREVIDELLNQQNKTIKKALKVVLQVQDKEKPVMAAVEQRIYRDLIEHAGAAQFWLIEHQNKMTDDEIIQFTKKH